MGENLSRPWTRQRWPGLARASPSFNPATSLPPWTLHSQNEPPPPSASSNVGTSSLSPRCCPCLAQQAGEGRRKRVFEADKSEPWWIICPQHQERAEPQISNSSPCKHRLSSKSAALLTLCLRTRERPPLHGAWSNRTWSNRTF